jgi:methyl-accepting chemotaxis protein
MPQADQVSNGYSFPNLRQRDPGVADKFAGVYKNLRDAGATAAAERLETMDGQVGRVPYQELEQLADPDRALDESSATIRRTGRRATRLVWSVRNAHLARNIVALLPLILTWITLALAASDYRNEVQAHPALATQSFLLLWQQGFGGRLLSFTWVAGLDAALLALVVLLTVWVHKAEVITERRQRAIARELYAAMDSLQSVGVHGAIGTSTSAEDWAAATRRVITEAMEQTRLLTQTSEEAIRTASERLAAVQGETVRFIEKFSVAIDQALTSFHDESREFIKNFATASQEQLGSLVVDLMRPLQAEMSTVLEEFRSSQAEYRGGIRELSGSVSSMSESARELVTSAGAYNKIADSITRNLDGMASSQQQFTTQVADSAQAMSSAATAMGQVASLHEGIHQSVRVNLDATTQAMKGTAQAMSTSAQSLANAISELPRTRRRWFGR